MKPIQTCCDEWAKAHEGASDKELHGSCIYYVGPEPAISPSLDPVKFCPWCGASKVAPKARRKSKSGMPPCAPMPDWFADVLLHAQIADALGVTIEDVRSGVASEDMAYITIAGQQYTAKDINDRLAAHRKPQ